VVTGIRVQNEFDDDGSTAAPFVALGTEESGDAGEDAIVPALYAMDSHGDWRFGLGVNVPFGLSTKYEDDWIGRFAAIDSDVKSVNVNPALSYRLNQYFSLGAGIQLQHIDARLTNATLTAAGSSRTELEADDWGFGVTAGALIEPWTGTTIGVGFRSSVRHEVEGHGKISAAVGTVFRDDARAEVETPESIGVSIHQAITDRLSIAGTVEWTNWSRFDELRVTFDSGLAPDSVTEENWVDSYFYSLGVNYQLTPKLLLRGGVAYDETPIRNKYRTARLPDEDRLWVAGGFTYSFNEWASVDLGYAHLFVKDSDIRETMELTPNPAPVGTLQGTYENSVDLLAIQANIRF
jgi:long-chain fatty acid transport protein